MTEYSYYVQSSTLHFTNFAILLSSDKKSGFDSSFSWLAFSFIMAAIVVVILSVIAYEIFKRKERYDKEMKMNRLMKRVESISNEKGSVVSA